MRDVAIAGIAPIPNDAARTRNFSKAVQAVIWANAAERPPPRSCAEAPLNRGIFPFFGSR